MNKILIITIALLSAIAATAQMKTYSLNVGDFNELTLTDGINLRYVANPDSAGMAVFTCDPEMASMLMFTPSNQKLKVQLVDAGSTPPGIPTVTVYSSSLDKVANWSDSTLIVESMTPCSEFSAKVIGNGTIKVRSLRATKVTASLQTGCGTIYLKGQANTAKYVNIGAGTIEAASLEAANVNCQLGGVGSIDCYATSQLSVSGVGSGKVYYIGNPTVKKKTVGVKVISMEGVPEEKE